MIHKAIISTVVVALVGTVVFGRDVVSYVKTSAKSVRNTIRSEVPLDFEIERAREMVENLVPDIRQCMHQIAEAEVDVEHRNQDIQQQQAALAVQKEQILVLRTDFDSGKPVRYVGRTFTPEQVKRDLACRFERFKLAEETIGSKQKILQAREQSVSASREKLEQMLASKRTLEVKVENLQARLMTLQASEAASNINFDNTRLARAKKLIDELSKKLNVRTKVLDAEGRFTGLIPVETKDYIPADLAEQIDAHFGLDKTEADDPNTNTDA